jgi:uncharacterized protein with HEPN domain
MQPEAAKLLWDLLDAAEFAFTDTATATLESRLADRRLRQSTEQSLEIIAEVLARPRRLDEHLTDQITDARRITGLRNRLAHGYKTDVDDAIMWKTVQESVPLLREEAARLLEAHGGPPD